MARAMPEQETVSSDVSDLEQALTALITTGNNAERCFAVRALGLIPTAESAGVLVDALRDADPDVRCDAAEALARLGAKDACRTLVENLREDPVPEAKTQYIKSLQSLGADGCQEMLAALAIGRGEQLGIAWDDAYSDWDDWLDVQLTAIEALGVLGGSDAPDVIVTALCDPEGQDLWPVACKALARLGRRGVDTLCELIPQASELNRKRIASALSMTEPELSHIILQQLATDEDARVRLAAMESAAEIGSDETLVLGLHDVAPEVRAAAIAGLSSPGAAALDKALNDISPVVVIAACMAIERAGQVVPGLNLATRIERSLRTKSPELIAAMLSAAVIAEPRKAAELVEDICSHKNTTAKVRSVCLRSASRLKLPGVVDLLAEAVSAGEQSVRMEAISALAGLAKGEGLRATQATQQLAETIAGIKISVPSSEADPEDNTVVQFVPKKGKQAAGDEGESSLKLDRDGNELPVPDVSDKDSIEEAVAIDQDVPEPAPLSTLQAIMAVNPDRMQADKTVELEDADLSFLEMTGSLVRRRKLDPEAKLPAHIDVRRLAAGVAGDTGKSSLVPGLALAATDRDAILSDAALSSLRRLADSGVDVSDAEAEMLVMVAGRDDGRCRQAIPVLAATGSANALDAVRQAIGHHVPQVRTAAVKSLANTGHFSSDQFETAIGDADHQVRLAAVEATLNSGHPNALSHLLGQAQAESGRHKHDAAKLMASCPVEGLAALTDWVAGSDTQNRYLALDMLPVLLVAMANREEEPGHAATS